MYVENEDSLLEAIKEWKKNDILAIDLECENNLHHYGQYISLIQISDKNTNWIIDVVKIKDITPLIKLIEDKNITKIFHDIGFDFRILNKQFNCKPKNTFDTQIAASLLGEKNIGLGSLLEKYFSIKKESKFQRADWTKRPLSVPMLSYAAKDTAYLIELSKIFKKMLKEKKRWFWVEEEFLELDKKEFTIKKSNFLDMRGLRELNETQLGILKELFFLREKLAKKSNLPGHFIIRNKSLIQFASKQPHWKKVRGVHPIVRKEADLFFEAVKKGKNHPITKDKKINKKLSLEKKELFNKIQAIRTKISDLINIKSHLIINKDQMIDMVVTGKTTGLKNWQKSLLDNYGLKELNLK